MDLGLKDKVVVVTGASKGIGLATARLLLQEGAKVAICSVTESHLREAEQELSRLGAVYAEVVDMTQEQSVYAFAIRKKRVCPSTAIWMMKPIVIL